MDDILAPLARRGASSTFVHDEQYGRTRGRTLRQHHYASYDTRTGAFAATGVGGEEAGSSSGVGVNKIWKNVRRSLSIGAVGGKRTHYSGMAEAGMHSTPEEALPPPSSFSHFHNSRATSPTIEQIAMGLHISRTPHLRTSPRASSSRGRLTDPPRPQSAMGPPRPSRPMHLRRGSAPPIAHPPPPARSSLKKPSVPSTPTSSRSAILTPSDSNASLSTLTTSTAPSTPRSHRSSSRTPSLTQSTFASRLQLGVKLLLPTRKNSVSSTSDDDSASSELTPRKVVRFSVMTGEPDEKL